jgi:hypothetical protein
MAADRGPADRLAACAAHALVGPAGSWTGLGCYMRISEGHIGEKTNVASDAGSLEYKQAPFQG